MRKPTLCLWLLLLLFSWLADSVQALPRLDPITLDLSDKDFDEKRFVLFAHLNFPQYHKGPSFDACDRPGFDELLYFGCVVHFRLLEAQRLLLEIPATGNLELLFDRELPDLGAFYTDSIHADFYPNFGSPETKVHLRTADMAELGITLAFPANMDLAPYFTLNVGEESLETGANPVYTLVGGAYRSLVGSGLAARIVRVEPVQPLIWAKLRELYPDPEAYFAFLGRLYSVELLVVARRMTGACAMSATVSGDIDRYVFGDYAYFNVSEVPVKEGMMAGNMIEATTFETTSESDGGASADASVSAQDQANEVTNSALSLAAELGLMDEEDIAGAQESLENANVGEDVVLGSGGGFGEWALEELRAEDPATGDNFGLNLSDLKSDVTPKEDAPAGAMLSNAFTLTLSGRLDIQALNSNNGENPASPNIEVRPSAITATVGLSDRGGDRIPFELPEDGALNGGIVISREDPEYIFGSLKAELETKGVYNLEGTVQRGGGVVAADKPRRLKIEVEATFAARRGSLSCIQ